MIAPIGIARAYEILDRMEQPPPTGGRAEVTLARIQAQAAHVQAIAAVHQAQAAQLLAVTEACALDEKVGIFTLDERKRIRATIRNLMGFDLVAPTTTEEKSPWPAS